MRSTSTPASLIEPEGGIVVRGRKEHLGALSSKETQDIRHDAVEGVFQLWRYVREFVEGETSTAVTSGIFGFWRIGATEVTTRSGQILGTHYSNSSQSLVFMESARASHDEFVGQWRSSSGAGFSFEKSGDGPVLCLLLEYEGHVGTSPLAR